MAAWNPTNEKDSPYAINADQGMYQNEIWEQELYKLSEVYTMFVGYPRRDGRTEAERAEEVNTAPREPGCFFDGFDSSTHEPSTEHGTLHPYSWLRVGPVEGPHTKKMSSLDPGPHQRYAEQRLCDRANELTPEEVHDFLRDFFPSKKTIGYLLWAIPNDSRARRPLEQIWKALYAVPEPWDLRCPSPEYTPQPVEQSASSPRSNYGRSPERDFEPSPRPAKRSKGL